MFFEFVSSENIGESSKANSELMFSKRNSVLFEALDLKNVENIANKKSASHNFGAKKQITPSNLLSSIAASPVLNAKNMLATNQNFAIRSEGLVPNIVKSCCKHISEHGLDVVGIFRIDSSKKRIKEIKEMFDTGKQVILDDSFNPNDAACILKEYLRSLPEPLLTRELYAGFLAASKIKDNEQKLATVRLLVCLLPVPNRDTLQVLLKLLDKVRNHSNPIVKEDPNQHSPCSSTIGGNKMDSFNLAMVRIRFIMFNKLNKFH